MRDALRPVALEYWIIMVLLPFIIVALLIVAAAVLQVASAIMAMTRFPVWYKRTFWRYLSPPTENTVEGDDEGLAGRIRRLGANAIKKARWKAASVFTKPLPKALVRMMYDQIWNTSHATAIYYMNACKQSLSVLSCVYAGQTEQNGTSFYQAGFGVVDLRHLRKREYISTSRAQFEPTANV